MRQGTDMTREPTIPRHQQGRLKHPVNLTLDTDTIKRLETLKERHQLESLSQTVRWLSRTARPR